jgi:hypothetical protein
MKTTAVFAGAIVLAVVFVPPLWVVLGDLAAYLEGMMLG